VDCEPRPPKTRVLPVGWQHPGRPQDLRDPQDPQERQEHDQGVEPPLAQVAALDRGQRQFDCELDEEQPPEYPAQSCEPPPPRSADLPGQLDDRQQYQRQRGQGERHVQVTVQPLAQLLARRGVVPQALGSCFFRIHGGAILQVRGAL
jgi:hypothetical protein